MKLLFFLLFSLSVSAQRFDFMIDPCRAEIEQYKDTTTRQKKIINVYGKLVISQKKTIGDLKNVVSLKDNIIETKTANENRSARKEKWLKIERGVLVGVALILTGKIIL